MGRTLRKNLKKHQNAPHIIYLLRKWKFNSKNNNETLSEVSVSTPQSITTPKSWADWDEDDSELPPSPFIEDTVQNPWFSSTNTSTHFHISPIQEYIYKNR